MNREAHVRICESVRGRFPRATRLCQRKSMRFAFIDGSKADYPVRLMARLLEVSPQGYYAWHVREPCHRERERVELKVLIRAAHTASRGTYGSPRIHADFKQAGYRIGRKRVARIMRDERIRGCRPRSHKVTTDSSHNDEIVSNVLNRDFAPTGANVAWVSDITYIRTWAGWLYLAVIIDLYSRRVVGWSIDDHMRKALVIEALESAAEGRPTQGVIHHSDRGSQYTSGEYRSLMSRLGMTVSMSRKGNCWDNAPAESFFATLKTELIHRRPWPTKQSAIDAVNDYIALFYNSSRRHSFTGGLSPIDYERAFDNSAALAA